MIHKFKIEAVNKFTDETRWIDAYIDMTHVVYIYEQEGEVDDKECSNVVFAGGDTCVVNCKLSELLVIWEASKMKV